MQIELKITATPEESKDMLPYTNAIERDLFLWELFNNFFRKFDSEESEKIRDMIYELKNDYGVITT